MLGGYGSVVLLIVGLAAPAEGLALNGRVNAYKIGGTSPMVYASEHQQQ